MSDDPRFPITAAQLVGNWCETLFYGIYLVTCTFAARTLLLTGRGREERWLRLGEIRWLMVFFALAFFIISTLDVALGLYHNYIAFITFKQGPLAEFLNLGDWVNVARSLTQVIIMILGDSVLIYRCWIVYGRRWSIIFPSLALFLTGIAMAIRFVELQIIPSTNKKESLNASEITHWGIAFFAITTAQNLLSTGLLISRIWRVDRQNERYFMSGSTGQRQPRHLRKVMTVIAESGAFYTLTVFITLVLGATESNGLYPVADITLQSTGIVFNIILVRSSRSRDQQFSAYNTERSTWNGTTAMQKITVNTVRRQDVEGSITAVGVHSGSKFSQSEVYSPGISATNKGAMAM